MMTASALESDADRLKRTARELRERSAHGTPTAPPPFLPAAKHPTAEREREPINIAPSVRARLRALLFQPEFQGVGYSAFINRAVEIAETEIMQQRTARSDAQR